MKHSKVLENAAGNLYRASSEAANQAVKSYCACVIFRADVQDGSQLLVCGVCATSLQMMDSIS